ncbi:MAG: hypothetical protein ACREH8_06450 [Opitutaceae bacterium]
MRSKTNMKPNIFIVGGIFLCALLACAAAGGSVPVASAETRAYLNRIYNENQRTFGFVASHPEEAAVWRESARQEIVRLLGLPRTAAQLGSFSPRVELGDSESFGTFTRRSGVIWSEPEVAIPFWLFRPKGKGPFPVGIFPHGHSPWPEYAGIASDEAGKKKIEVEERDVAVQAAERGYIAIAHAVRGLAVAGVPDIAKSEARE